MKIIKTLQNYIMQRAQKNKDLKQKNCVKAYL